MATQDSGDRPFDELQAADDELIATLIKGDPMDAEAVDGGFSFGDTVGKVDDAVDYEDISDDDLPSEEDVPSGPSRSAEDDDEDVGMGGDLLAEMAAEGEVEGGKDMDFDDLFGDMGGDMSDPVGPPAGDGDLGDLSGFDLANETLPSEQSGLGESDDLFGAVNYGAQDMSMDSIQADDPVDLARQYFPDFRPHSILSFSTLFKAKPGTLQTGPQKVPKVCVPTKINVEMAPDENTLFNKATGNKNAAHRERGVVIIPPPVEEGEDEDEDTEEGKEPVDPVFERDLEIACCDWDSKIEAAMISPPPSPQLKTTRSEYDGAMELARPNKVRFM
jgi:hypothetical protein